MKSRLTRIIPFAGIIICAIYLLSCHQAYDSNKIPTSSTSNKTSDELYNGISEGPQNEPKKDRIDTGHTQEMEPGNSTGASTLTTPGGK